MGGSLLFKAEVPSSSLLDHLPKEFFLRLTWCPWLVGYYGIRGLVEVHVSLLGYPRYLKKIKKNSQKSTFYRFYLKKLSILYNKKWLIFLLPSIEI